MYNFQVKLSEMLNQTDKEVFMKSIKIGVILTLAALFIFACSNSTVNNTTTENSTNTAAININKPAATPADELASVRKIYADNCVKCHKENGMGGANEVDGKPIKVPDFTSDKVKANYDEADWIDVITNGAGSKMPAFKDKIGEADMKNLVKLIRKDFQGK